MDIWIIFIYQTQKKQKKHDRPPTVNIPKPIKGDKIPKQK